MNDVRIIEPLGERTGILPLQAGGDGDLVLPGVEGGAFTLVEAGRHWQAEPAGGADVTLNGVALRGPTPLAEGDVLAAGAAQVVVHPATGRIEVWHQAGNATIAPLRQQVLPGDEIEAGVREVFAADAPAEAVAASRPVSRRMRVVSLGVVGALLLGIAALLLALVPVPLQVSPEQARITSPGLVDWHSGDRMFLLPGRRELQISHAGYRPQTLTLDVRRALANAMPLAVQLEYLPGRVTVDTGGVKGQLLVDGRAAGEVPGEIEISAGAHDLIVRAPRHLDYVTRVEVEGGGKAQQVVIQLEASVGYLAFDTAPAGARVIVDGEDRGVAPQRIELDAGLHRLQLTAPGRRAWSSEVAIIAGQTLDLGRVDLAQPAAVAVARSAVTPTEPEQAGPPADEAASAQIAPPRAPSPPPPSRVQSPLLGTLVLLPAGEYLQGSDRREQGRRSNEVQRTVKLTRPFYLAATEVSNAQFRTFRASHAAGSTLGRSLDLETQAASNVTWNDAVEFCNWLSQREDLPLAYERRDGRWQLVQPLNNGYRLPTEAEWEYAARYVDGRRWQRYPWGEGVPPPPGGANVAGEEAVPDKPALDAPLLGGNLPQYRDEHPVISPVQSYAASPAGLYGMGGNVSEWVHDVYESMPAGTTVTDPFGPDRNGPHTIRGPSWRTSTISELRAAWRERGPGASQSIGFRVARFAGELP